MADYESARRTADRLGEKVADQLFFSTPYQRSQFISFPLDYDGKPKSEIVEKCREKKSELEAKARTAIENARPDTALNPLQSVWKPVGAILRYRWQNAPLNSVKPSESF